MSKHSFAASHCSDSCISDVTGQPNFSRICARISNPFFIPTPL